MSYSTRRGGGIAGNQQHNNVGGIGQRRPVVTNNFVPGGTVNAAQPKHGPVNPQQRQTGTQNTPGIHFRNVQQKPQQGQPQIKSEPQIRPPNTPLQTPVARQAPPQSANQQRTPAPQANQQPEQKVFPTQQPQQQVPPKQPPQQQLPQQQPPPQQQQLPQPLQPIKPLQQQQPGDQQQAVKVEDTVPAQPENGGGDSMDTAEQEQQSQPQQGHRRKPWFRRNVPRREMIRRRNFKLSKILKPKNAVAILNEIIKDLSYEVTNVSNRSDGRSFKASVNYDGIVHEGYGFTEEQAKNGAAEVVLKHYIKTNKMGDQQKKPDEGVEKMEVAPDDENAHVPLPWQHVASFAIYKLFSQWEEDPNLVGISASYLNVKSETKSSKKMPPNPETINPLMLLNQMMPQARFEEIGRTGNPPQIIFSFKCTVDEHSFIGSGTSKKIAKRTAAFEACYKLLGITYPPDVFVPSNLDVY